MRTLFKLVILKQVVEKQKEKFYEEEDMPC